MVSNRFSLEKFPFPVYNRGARRTDVQELAAIAKKPSDWNHISYMFKIHPNHAQQQLINQTFGCVRFVYNTILHHNLNDSN
ncbi:helix-turn-helix domain-containing protein [Metabacillus sp. KIGAM252]|uniref:Helix-turn-helix domain-containing protein n=1 Tax=Metabacillus flavus TaxID=2823519 RepID=A0ABS5LFN8_9BACI|nr:helix-turn-helix domain-containing protein [Metabacillus flavus]